MSKSGTVNTAKTIQAIGLNALEQGAYIAFGSGDTNWDTTQTGTFTFVADAFAIVNPNSFADGVRLFEQGNPTNEYIKGVDFEFLLETGTVTRIPTGAIPIGATVDVEYVSVGLVQPSQTALIQEIARKKASMEYVVRNDVDGAIFIDAGRYDVSPTPTPLLLVSSTFTSIEIPGTSLREAGLFFETQVNLGNATTTETFSNDKITIDPLVGFSNQSIDNVVITSSDNLTTYVEGTDYILNKETTEVYRLQSGSIIVAQEVNVAYDKIDKDVFEPADLADAGLLYVAENFKLKDRDALGNITQQFLISLTA